MSNNSENTIQNYLFDKYSKDGYLNKYGSSVIITVLTLLAFSTAFGYNHFQSKLKFLKKNWNEIRCNPLFIPFAGLINAPKGTSKLEYTEKNLNHCMYDVLEDIVEVEKVAHSAAQTIANDTVSGIDEAMNSVRSLMSEIRSSISNLFMGIFSKIHNVLIPMQNTMIKAKNNINNSQAVLSSAMYTGVGSLMAFRSFLGAFVFIVILFIAILTLAFPAELASALGLVGIPFVGWILASPFFIAAMVTIALIIAIVAIFVPLSSTIQQILTNTDRIRNASSYCFDEDTELLMENGEKRKIKDIKIGEVLFGGNEVTAVLKLSSHNQEMYSLRDIIVSGSHSYYDYNNDICRVRNNPESILITKYTKPYIYCINTSNKEIIINNIRFMDWDEISNDDISKLINFYKQYIPTNLSKQNFHSYLDSGFSEDTLIELEDGRSIPISKLDVNDILKFGERVLGIVQIKGTDIKNIKKFKIKNNEIICSANQHIKNKDLGSYKSLLKISGSSEEKEILYQILTDKESFYINNLNFLDYRANLEQLIDKTFPNYCYSVY